MPNMKQKTKVKIIQVSNFIEDPAEEVVYYEESFPGEFDDAVVVDYEETSFDEQVFMLFCLLYHSRLSSLGVGHPFSISPFHQIQSFFSSSEKPDFNPTIPEFTSEKFYGGE